MSNLLKEAIVDAKALKEVALKNAEAAIIEKYSLEVKEAFDKLLEQEAALDTPAPATDAADPLAALADPAADLAAPTATDDGFEEQDPASAEEVVADEDAPLAAADNLSGSSREGDVAEFDLDLGVLQEAIKDLQASLEEQETFEIAEEELIEILSEEEEALEEDVPKRAVNPDDDPKEPLATPTTKTKEEESEEYIPENINIDADLDSLVDAITEKLTVDMGAELSGWAGRSSYDMKWEMEKELAHRRSTEIEEELEIMKKAHEELVFENKQLKEQLLQYKQATNELREGLQDVNLSNARLLYTNRVLRNTSLNERQKERIVEAISSAGSVTEARTIFDTLQSTVQATPKKSPQSLSEAITRRSSVIRASRKESTSSDPFQDRMKTLAGIK